MDQNIGNFQREGKSRAYWVKRALTLDKAFQIEVLKTTVISETARLFPDVLPGLILALDKKPKWWSARRDLSIEKWRDIAIELMKKANK